MKLLLFIASIISAKAETKEFKEVNAGSAWFLTSNRPDSWETHPGASILRGQKNEGELLFAEYEYGIAYPFILTAKLAAGIKLGKLHWSSTFRPWPLSVGQQIEVPLENFSIVASYERWYDPNFDHLEGEFATVGVRWNSNWKK